MAITTRAGLIAATAAGRTVQFQKGTVPTSTAAYFTTFRGAGMPGVGPTPPGTTGAQLSRATQGAIPIPAPSGTSYFTSFEAVSSQAQTIILCDRLVEFGGLSGIVTTAQTVSALALPARATGATDVELWLEIFTAIGGTAVATVTASYTNQSGTAGRTATLVGGIPTSGNVLHRSYPLTLQAGDTGVQSVQSLTLGSTSGTAGNLGLVLRRPLLSGNITTVNIGFVQGWTKTDMTVCPDDACLEILSLTGTATFGTGTIMGALGIAQG